MSEQEAELNSTPQQDSNGATDTIEVAKSEDSQGQVVTEPPANATPGTLEDTGVRDPNQVDAPVPGSQPEGEADPTPPGTSITGNSGSPQQEEAAAPDPRTLDGDGNPVPDMYAPVNPPAHDPSVHAMATAAVQKVGSGFAARFEHVVAAVARFAHNHPELDRILVQGLLDELSAIEKVPVA